DEACANALFQTGMPDPSTGAPTGASVAVGDVLVADGVYYPIVEITSETALRVANVPSGAVSRYGHLKQQTQSFHSGNLPWAFLLTKAVSAPANIGSNSTQTLTTC